MQTLLPQGYIISTVEEVLAYITFVAVPLFATFIMLNFFVAQVRWLMDLLIYLSPLI